MELVKIYRRQFIDGEWVESSNKETRKIINPFNQEVILKLQKEQPMIASVQYWQLDAHLKMANGLTKQVKIAVKSESNL